MIDIKSKLTEEEIRILEEELKVVRRQMVLYDKVGNYIGYNYYEGAESALEWILGITQTPPSK